MSDNGRTDGRALVSLLDCMGHSGLDLSPVSVRERSPARPLPPLDPELLLLWDRLLMARDRAEELATDAFCAGDENWGGAFMEIDHLLGQCQERLERLR